MDWPFPAKQKLPAKTWTVSQAMKADLFTNVSFLIQLGFERFAHIDLGDDAEPLPLERLGGLGENVLEGARDRF
jgi:hypothetical protein